ncbi:hypothetical protein OF83DRAFT_1056438 [Amylostereum chailletii]|nr:hypothetical protein OF83DRAFT_1056438 [Amylostereum chailletii]
MASPSLSARSGSPYSRSPRNSMNFEVEHAPLSPKPARPGLRRGMSEYAAHESVLHSSIARIVAAKSRPFAVSGRIPVDPAHLNLFFRTKSGITHSLDFPIDVDYDTPPALDVLIAACQPHPALEPSDYSEADSLFYPSNLPLTTTLEIANHPILEAIRNTLFPSLPAGHYLTTLRDKLEIVGAGARMPPQPLPADGRVATVLVTLPVRHRGGALRVRTAEGEQETYHGRGGKAGHMDWVAFFSDCEVEVEPVQKGCRITIAYAVHLRSFGPAGVAPDPLITPSDEFLDNIAPVLNIMRGRMLAFHLTGDYGVNPGEVLAESLVPYLKGGDSVLYHAFKLYKLSPELRWAAGGYIWPVDRVVQVGPYITPESSPYAFASRDVLGAASEEEEFASIRYRVEESGAVPLASAEIVVLTDRSTAARERVPMVTAGVLDKLVVNILLVVYVP